jgi:hypothetical protein
MKILFDQGTPVPLRTALTHHSVQTAYELSWQELENGALIGAAEKEGFELLITTDQNLRYQQNLTGRRLAILVLKSTSWPRIRAHLETILPIVDQATPGSYQEVPIP